VNTRRAIRHFFDGLAWAIALGATFGFILYLQAGGH
jgi:hypothetical protein